MNRDSELLGPIQSATFCFPGAGAGAEKAIMKTKEELNEDAQKECAELYL